MASYLETLGMTEEQVDAVMQAAREEYDREATPMPEEREPDWFLDQAFEERTEMDF